MLFEQVIGPKDFRVILTEGILEPTSNCELDSCSVREREEILELHVLIR